MLRVIDLQPGEATVRVASRLLALTVTSVDWLNFAALVVIDGPVGPPPPPPPPHDARNSAATQRLRRQVKVVVILLESL